MAERFVWNSNGKVPGSLRRCWPYQVQRVVWFFQTSQLVAPLLVGEIIRDRERCVNEAIAMELERKFAESGLAETGFGVTLHSQFSHFMKADIHPNYVETNIACACGAVYHTRSTKKDIRIGICAACHPFFTGEQKFVDTAGRIEKFSRRYGTEKSGRAVKKA